LPAVRWPILQHRLSAVRSSLQARARHLVTSAIIPNAGAAVHLVRAGYDAEGADGFCRGEGGVDEYTIARTVGEAAFMLC
jgi:hypothetical protein